MFNWFERLIGYVLLCYILYVIGHMIYGTFS